MRVELKVEPSAKLSGNHSEISSVGYLVGKLGPLLAAN